MAIQVSADFMALEVNGEVVATARFSEHAARLTATGRGSSRSTRPAVQQQPGDHGRRCRR
jgi:hypothetical protein